MNKYYPRDTSIPGSSVTETHSAFRLDRIVLERNIRSRWTTDYGLMFNGNQLNPVPSRSAPYQNSFHGHGGAEKGLEKGHGCLSGPRWPPKGRIPQVTSGFRAEQEKCVLAAPIGRYNCDGSRAEANVSKDRQAVGQWHEVVKAPKMAYPYRYPTPGNSGRHVVQNHVTGYSSSFGHHSVQSRNQNQIYAKKRTLASDLHLQTRSDAALQIKHPHDVVKSKRRSSYDSSVDKLCGQLEDCSLAVVQRPNQNVAPVEICSKCGNCLCATCVLRRGEKIAKDDSGNVPGDALLPCLPQVWCGPSYSGSRVIITEDILQWHHRLSRDPAWKTPMNRTYDEMKTVNYYMNATHSNICRRSNVVYRMVSEAACGTRFDEQLRKGNSFTKGDTKFKSCAYKKTL